MLQREISQQVAALGCISISPIQGFLCNLERNKVSPNLNPMSTPEEGKTSLLTRSPMQIPRQPQEQLSEARTAISSLRCREEMAQATKIWLSLNCSPLTHGGSCSRAKADCRAVKFLFVYRKQTLAWNVGKLQISAHHDSPGSSKSVLGSMGSRQCLKLH